MTLKYDPSRLNNREKMLICNYKGVLTRESQAAFAKLFGTDEMGSLHLSVAVMIKAREKLKEEVRK